MKLLPSSQNSRAYFQGIDHFTIKVELRAYLVYVYLSCGIYHLTTCNISSIVKKTKAEAVWLPRALDGLAQAMIALIKKKVLIFSRDLLNGQK